MASLSLAALRLKFQAVIGDSGGDVGVLGFVFGDWFGTGLVLEMIGVVRDLRVEGLAGLDLSFNELVTAATQIENELGVVGIHSGGERVPAVVVSED